MLEQWAYSCKPFSAALNRPVRKTEFEWNMNRLRKAYALRTFAERFTHSPMAFAWHAAYK
jgi:hypothetical protein